MARIRCDQTAAWRRLHERFREDGAGFDLRTASSIDRLIVRYGAAFGLRSP